MSRWKGHALPFSVFSAARDVWKFVPRDEKALLGDFHSPRTIAHEKWHNHDFRAFKRGPGRPKQKHERDVPYGTPCTMSSVEKFPRFRLNDSLQEMQILLEDVSLRRKVALPCGTEKSLRWNALYVQAHSC